MTWSHVDATPVPADGTDLMQALVDLGAFLVRDEPGRDIAPCASSTVCLFDFRLACLLGSTRPAGRRKSSATHRRIWNRAGSQPTMVDMVVRERKTLLVQDVVGGRHLGNGLPEGIRSAMVTLMQDDEVLGVLYVDHENPCKISKPATNGSCNCSPISWRRRFRAGAYVTNRVGCSHPKPALAGNAANPPGYAVAARLVPACASEAT
jgi:hypothetical protein